MVAEKKASQVATDKAVLMYANKVPIKKLLEDAEIAKLFAQFEDKKRSRQKPLKVTLKQI